MENEVRLVTKTRSILPSAKCVKVRRVRCVARKRKFWSVKREMWTEKDSASHFPGIWTGTGEFNARG